MTQLVAMQFLGLEDDRSSAKYYNTPAGARSILVAIACGAIVMLNARRFRFWNDLPEALRTGKP